MEADVKTLLRRRTPWLLVAAFALMIALGAGLLAACGGGTSETASPGATAAADQTLVVAARMTPNGIDHDFYFSEEEHQIRAAIYENLMALGTTTDENGLVVPSYEAADLQGRLAESWEVSDDNRVLTVKLREGVMSHAGNELTAEDVQYTWDRSWAVNGAQAFYAQFVLLLKEPSWEVVDKYTWKISTKDPNPLIDILMANNDLNIYDSIEVKKHATDEDPWAIEWMANHDAGHGAYTLDEWSPGNQVVLKAYDNYYRGKAAIGTVVYKAVPEGSNRRALVESGEVDIAENVPFRELKALEESEAVKIWKTEGNRVFRFELSNKTKPFSDVRVRKALLYATPTEDILSTVFFGYAKPLLGPVPSNYPMADTTTWNYTHDPEKAKELLKEAGVKEGTSFTITFDSESDLARNTATILKTAYEDVGLAPKLEEVSSATYTTELYKRKYAAFFLLEFAIIPDAGYALALNYPSDSFLNTTAYSNKEVDKLIADGFRTADQAERADIYAEAQRIMIADDPPEVWLAQPGWQLVTSPSISGVAWDTPNLYPFYDLRK